MKRLLMVSSAVFAIAVSTQAQARDAEQTTAEPAGVSLDEIIVTAQRRSENLQKAAVAVSAVTGQALVSAGISDTAGLTRLVPALVVQPAGGNTTFYLRGVGTLSGNAFGENAIAYNVGGVYYGRPTAPNGSFYDLDRVEVVKGPQGTLYGRNATGGAINILPNRPKLGTLAAELTGEVGNYSQRKLGGMINAPLGEDFAVRLAAQTVTHDGYMSDGYDDEDSTSARASLFWQPSDTWSALVTADYFKQEGKGPGGVTVPSAFYPRGPAVEDRIGGSDPRSIAALATQFGPLVNSGLVAPPKSNGYLNNEFWGVSAVIEGDLGFGTLTITPAYRSSKPDLRFFVTGFEGDIVEDVDQTSLEARLSSKGEGPLQYVVGAFLFDEKQQAVNSFPQGLIATTYFAPNLETQSRAVFGQGTYALTDRFRLVAGARYTKEDKTQSTQFRQYSGPVANGPLIPIVGDLSFDSVTYKAGFEWDAGPASLLYANVATGFKAGGFFPSVRDNTYDPEKLTAYTLGSKNRFLDNRLQLNAEIFYWKYKDQQISYNGPILANNSNLYTQANVTTNVGNATIKGVEIEGRFQVVEGGAINANVQYLDATYDSFIYNAFSPNGAAPRVACPSTLNTALPVAAPAAIYKVDCSGRPAINAPKWSMNLGYDQTFDLPHDLKLTAGFRTRIESSRYLSIEYLAEQRQSSYSMSDAYLTLASSSGRLSATAFINNIGNETVYSTSYPRPILGVVYNGLRPPRTYGLRLTARY